MTTQPAIPDPVEAAEICRVARTGGTKAGAKGAVLDDVVQVVAVTIVSKWSEPHVVAARGRDAEAWHAYIMVCARNAYRDIERVSGRRRSREQRSLGPTGAPLPDRPGVVRQREEAPSNLERYLARRLIADLIEEHLEGRSKQVAALEFIDGLTTNEIAERLGMPVRSVNRAKRAAIMRLRGAIRSHGAAGSG